MSNKIRALREKKGLSQAEVARAVGLTQPRYSNFENHKAGWRDIERFKRLADLLGCSMDELVGGGIDEDNSRGCSQKVAS